MMNLVFVAVVSLLAPPPSLAFTSGAGGCAGGTAAAQHGGSFGTLEEGNFQLLVDDAVVSSSDTASLTAMETHTLKVQSTDGTPIRGVLFRMDFGGSNMFDLAPVGPLKLAPDTTCFAPIAGVTHMDSSDKASVEALFEPMEEREATLDLTVVVSNNPSDGNVYFYSPFTFSVTADVVTDPPTVSPTTAMPVTTAPTLAPTDMPVTIAPTVAPTAMPVTSAPTVAPTAAPTTMPVDEATGAPVDEPMTEMPVTTAPTAMPVDETEFPTAMPVAAPETEMPVETEAPVTLAPNTTIPVETEAPTTMNTSAPVAAPTPMNATDSPTDMPMNATDSPTAMPSLTEGAPTSGSGSSMVVSMVLAVVAGIAVWV